ncbi:hypothetical protein MRX96_028468 [Rhipicephalus microplus]
MASEVAARFNTFKQQQYLEPEKKHGCAQASRSAGDDSKIPQKKLILADTRSGATVVKPDKDDVDSDADLEIHVVHRVQNLQDTERLRTLYDKLQVGVGSLEAFGVDSSTYNVLLLTVLRKNIPNELCLEYFRRKTATEAFPDDDFQEVLNFMKAEVES